MNFKDLTVEDRREISIKGGQARRSPELRWAWANADELRKENQQLNIKALSVKYKISYRSMRRIVKGN